MEASDNDYLRDSGKRPYGESFTSIASFVMENKAVDESQGRIADRRCNDAS